MEGVLRLLMASLSLPPYHSLTSVARDAVLASSPSSSISSDFSAPRISSTAYLYLLLLLCAHGFAVVSKRIRAFAVLDF